MYKESDLRKFMLTRGMRWYDALFVFGLISLFFIYFYTNSFEAAITISVCVWAIALGIYLCYRFELGDEYYRKVKTVNQSIATRLVNILLSISFIIFALGGSFLGAYFSIMLFEQNWITMFIGIPMGAVLAIQIYYRLIIKNIFS